MATRRRPHFLNHFGRLMGASVWAPVLSILSMPVRSQAESGPELGSGTQLLSVLLSLVLILVLIFALGWFLRRFSQGSVFGQKGMKVVASLPLGTRERLVLVELGGQQILLGVTPQQVRTLHFFETPIIDSSERAEPSDFRQKLQAFIQPDKTGKR